MHHLEWQKATSGAFVAETANCRLIVQWILNPQHARFQVLERLPGGFDALIRSGVTESVGDAMSAAEKTVRGLPKVVHAQ